MSQANVIVCYGPTAKQSQWQLQRATLEDIQESELIVKIVATGICHSDLLFAELPEGVVRYPRVLGHEGQHEWTMIRSDLRVQWLLTRTGNNRLGICQASGFCSDGREAWRCCHTLLRIM